MRRSTWKLVILCSVLALVVSAMAPALSGVSRAEAAVARGWPAIGYDTNAISFSVMQGDVKTRVAEVNVWNDGGGILVLSAKADQPWVEPSPSLAVCVGQPSRIKMKVKVQVAELGLGTHQAVVTLAATVATHGPVQIPVDVEVVKPRALGPALAGLPTQNPDQPLSIDPAGGTLNYTGVTAYMINGPDRYHCPIFDMLQARLTGQTWEMELQYGALTSDNTGGYSYDYCPITGGSIASDNGDIKQYWRIETVGVSEGVQHPDGIPAEGNIVGGKLIKWCSLTPAIPGGGDNNWLVTIFVDTGDIDTNGDDPGTLTYKCWLVDQVTMWLTGIVDNLKNMSFNPVMWQAPEEGTLASLLKELSALQDLIGRFMTHSDEDVTVTTGPLVDALRPLMPQLSNMLPTLWPIVATMVRMVGPSTPPVLIMQPALTPCPIIEFTFGNGAPYRY